MHLSPHHHLPTTWPVGTVWQCRRALCGGCSGCTCPGFVPDKFHLELLDQRRRPGPTFTASEGAPRPPELEISAPCPHRLSGCLLTCTLRTLAGASNRAGIAANGVGSPAHVPGLAAVAFSTIAGLAGGARAPRTEVRRTRQKSNPHTRATTYTTYLSAHPHANARAAAVTLPQPHA
jgi:hypothetical protein